MTYAQMRNVAQQYGAVAVQTGVETASPHRLIQMLMEGALEKIVIAKAHMLQHSIAEKGANISWAISIIDGLRSSLDLEGGGEIARNLHALYDYMEHRLVEANRRNDPKILDEIGDLLREVKAGWDAIPADLHNAGGMDV